MAIKKCPMCVKTFTDNDKLYIHIESAHGEDIPDDWDGAMVAFYEKYDRITGKCMVCTGPTPWNHKTRKPSKLCGKKRCSDRIRENALKNQKIKNRMNDPKVQAAMLRARRISGDYRWSDGTLKSYTGSFEKDFLQYLDINLGFPSIDVFSPSPVIFYYMRKGFSLH